MKVKVKFLRPVFPHKSGEIGYIEEKKLKYFGNQIEILEEKKEEKKEIKNTKNKAILKSKFTKGL